MYDRIIRKALTTPWLITQEYCGIISNILRFRAAGGRLTAEELKTRIAGQERPARSSGGTIAVIPVWGVIANRNFDASSGMTSIEAIRPDFRRALADEEVKAIILDINSPGGTVPGVPEFAAEIFAARAQKPIVAFVDDLMASAAYYLGSQASEIVAISTADVGSIGVYLLHISEKGWLEKEGIKVTPITYGEHKLDTAPWEDLDEDTQAFLQAQVNQIGRDFEAAVARGRDVSVDVVRETFGRGRVFSAKEAKKLGMIDRIGTFEDAVARASTNRRRASASVAVPGAPLAADSDVCPHCNGSGVNPEDYMGDPKGQEPCEVCGGSGKPAAATTVDKATTDREALARTMSELDSL